jgi:NADH-quinone oxidoreductase subunit F
VMGSGGMIVVDEDTCMVEFAKFFLTFAQAESCGKCVPCRVGGKRMLEILTRITEGKGTMGDIDTIKEIAAGMETGSLCALGQLTPGPVMSALRYFMDEFIAHIEDGKCPAGQCKELTIARCLNACPAGVDVPGYIALTEQGLYAEALEVHRERNPFALACGRVCPAFCESQCRRGDIDQPVAVRHIKRFMADKEVGTPWTPKKRGEPREERVAIVGAGPAGLTAALRLAQHGYPVTIFEALPVAGGMMTVGIPDYRLPRDVLDIEIANIQRAGVEIRYNQAMGRDFCIDDLMNDGFKSVILAVGAHTSRRLGIEGEEKSGVYGGVDFLRDVNLGNAPDLAGKRVVVVGGGNVAIDAARSSLRLGATEVNVVYRRTRAEMPAYTEEIVAAEHEGVIFYYLTNPIKVVGDNKVTGVEVISQALGDFDRSGRRRPVPVEGSEFVIQADLLIPAIGQATDLSCLNGDGVDTNRNSTFVVDKSFATSRTGVFAIGDAALGPASVIEAVAQGNLVAESVSAYLGGGEIAKPVYNPPYHFPELTFDMEEYANARRPAAPELEPAQRRHTFDEVELGMSESVIKEECRRCLRCDLEWQEVMAKKGR